MHLSMLIILLCFAGICECNAESFLKSQEYFKKVKDNGESSAPEDIISSHAVHSNVECSLRCLRKSTCLAYNYRLKSNKRAINCQLCNKNQPGSESHDSGEWSSYQALKTQYLTTGFPKASEGNKQGSLNIRIRSEACDDPGRTPRCGLGIIQVNGTDYSQHGRGHNVVIVNADTGVIQQVKSFDTYGDDNADDRMIDFLNSLAPRLLVLIAIQDSSSDKMSAAAYEALEKVGAQNPLRGEIRRSYALLGWSGPGAPNFITQVQNERYNGPSIIAKLIGFPI